MCIVSLKSMTHAIKAQRALNEYGIITEITKLEPHMTHNGCAYGIKFNCMNLYLVKDALMKKQINYTEILTI